MKNFEEGFFDIKNFLVKRDEFFYRNKNNSTKVYHICYNVNDPYIHIMGASIVSVLENNPNVSFVFHIFTDGYSEDNTQKVLSLAKHWHCDCILYQLNMKPFEDFHIKVARFSRITYGRLYMPKILIENTSRYIYMDADAMCVGALSDLWNMDMQGAAMGAVSETPDAVAYRAGYLKLKSGMYFNDGVMLVDVNQWEKQKITEKSFSYQNEPRKRFLGQSQDVLNLVFDGTNYFLPKQYNMYGGGYHDNDDSIIVHWTGRRKPWQMVVSKFDEQWRKYNALSPWETITNIQPIKEPKNYHDFKYWGRYRKEKGYFGDYLKGMFWYSILKIRYKLGM